MTVPLYNLTDTWNDGGTVFTGLKLNVTNTASAIGSLIFDFQVGGSPKISGSVNGTLTCVDINIGPNIFASNTGNATFIINQFSSISFASSGIGSQDIYLLREGAGILAQRNSTNAQTFRVYNTFTDASNYERGVIDWTTSANVLTIDVQVLGTGTQRVISLNHLQTATGSTTALLGTSNCPATTGTAPYAWIKVTSSDGSIVYIPGWK